MQFAARDSLFCHRRLCHGGQRVGVRSRWNEASRQQAPIRSLLDIDCSARVLRTAEVMSPALSTAAVEIEGNQGSIPTPATGPSEGLGAENSGVAPATVTLALEEQWLNYMMELAYEWTTLTDGHRVKDILKRHCPNVPENVRRAVVRTIAFCRHPKWSEEEILRQLDPTMGAGVEARHEYVGGVWPPATGGTIAVHRGDSAKRKSKVPFLPLSVANAYNRKTAATAVRRTYGSGNITMLFVELVTGIVGRMFYKSLFKLLECTERWC